MSVLPHLEVLLLQDSSTTTLNELRCGRPMVLDFWHTKCVRCPAALERMNNEASSRTDVLFTACALSQGDGNEELVKEMVSESDWANLTHIFIDITTKEQAKSAFGFSSVPFCVVVDKDGKIVGSGDPKSMDLHELLRQNDVENIGSAVTNEQPIVKVLDAFVLDEDF